MFSRPLVRQLKMANELQSVKSPTSHDSLPGPGGPGFPPAGVGGSVSWDPGTHTGATVEMRVGDTVSPPGPGLPPDGPVGDNVGARVSSTEGLADGDPVGPGVGALVGSSVGRRDGPWLGVGVGPSVGPEVGDTVSPPGPGLPPDGPVGDNVGSRVGSTVGPRIGSRVGPSVETEEGALVGDTVVGITGSPGVGARVGDPVASSSELHSVHAHVANVGWKKYESWGVLDQNPVLVPSMNSNQNALAGG
jgi:hypothetical protein